MNEELKRRAEELYEEFSVKNEETWEKQAKLIFLAGFEIGFDIGFEEGVLKDIN